MDFTEEEKQALIRGRSGQVEGLWIVNPGGSTVACPLVAWDGSDAKKNPKGRKYDYGYRVATKEEVAAVEQLTVDANAKAEQKKVVLTKIVNDEPLQPSEAKTEMSWTEMKNLAKSKGIKSFGKTKEVLKEELGLS